MLPKIRRGTSTATCAQKDGVRKTREFTSSAAIQSLKLTIKRIKTYGKSKRQTKLSHANHQRPTPCIHPDRESWIVYHLIRGSPRRSGSPQSRNRFGVAAQPVDSDGWNHQRH